MAPFRAPKVYFAAKSGRTYIYLLEDCTSLFPFCFFILFLFSSSSSCVSFLLSIMLIIIKTVHYAKHVSQKEGADYEVAKRVVFALASFHSKFWNASPDSLSSLSLSFCPLADKEPYYVFFPSFSSLFFLPFLFSLPSSLSLSLFPLPPFLSLLLIMINNSKEFNHTWHTASMTSTPLFPILKSNKQSNSFLKIFLNLSRYISLLHLLLLYYW